MSNGGHQVDRPLTTEAKHEEDYPRESPQD
ncbi:hypothetical protein COLO4_02925 [Corchorus olitorius]|uniref:Uncharacterized protein n=1 Tax=Corchorus olitorius TaxID=93759 RepID=A0A1R3KZY4_9ROSI|nr:hypothetical protein COLO4_02925 [Corchorus olitorius]